MTKYCCPTAPEAGNIPEYRDIFGCGKEFDGEPDDEGLVDCPHCGIWFRHDEPGVQVEP